MNHKAWKGEIPVEFLYTAGVAGERFFSELRKRGELMGTRCPSCRVVYMPPRIYCEQCFTKLEEWVEVKNKGKVFSHTVLRRDRKGCSLEKPIIVAAVTFEGVRGCLVHRLEGIDPDKVKPGLDVEVVFKEPGERTGSILDIKGFHVVTKG